MNYEDFVLLITKRYPTIFPCLTIKNSKLRKTPEENRGSIRLKHIPFDRCNNRTSCNTQTKLLNFVTKQSLEIRNDYHKKLAATKDQKKTISL